MPKPLKEIDSRQIIAARGLLRWSREDLASALEMTSEGIKKIENGIVKPRSATLEKLVKSFEDRGVEFTEQCGVRLSDNTLRVLEGESLYLKMLDDVFDTLRDRPGEEALFAYVCNRLSPPAVVESDLRLRRLGVRFRSLIEEGDTYCLYPLREYRWIPSRFFQNNPQLIYAHKVASLIGTDQKKAFIIANAEYAETQRRLFNALWENSKMPMSSTAPQTYG